ncbi:hypothetical protein [Bdellovibrio bacteriovorus]|uniref:DUF1772 domain-containing protein n=1 Tax=Bdellovibrio bacteriovorus str. Tiberius TaxID=1069642 RepID=K7ZC94_BDEBC|nr:hypothetical protein [Bdellovibrio bacteriovorus]AFY03014.1 hypothetical protein Bdt_3339 [Bdellovibrio bacteriovorus str. Tiberius]
MAQLPLRICIYICVLSIGLFTGFVLFFAIFASQVLARMPLQQYLEFYRVSEPLFEPKVRLIYLMMIGSATCWLILGRRKWRSFEFICVASSLFCVLDEIILSYKGHYKINVILREAGRSGAIPAQWLSLRAEWTQFMFIHLLIITAGFILILMALYFYLEGEKKTSPEIKNPGGHPGFKDLFHRH